MDEQTQSPRCPRCGAFLTTNASGPCAACAFDACADATSIPATASSSRLPSAGLRADLIGERPSTEATVLEEGQTFGLYRIGRLLGRGGMGEVYEAEHLQHGRRVALKVLSQRLRRADDRDRFLQEGQLAAAVNHPNTVYIFSSEEVDDVPVITMELLPGGTLKDRVKASGPLPPPEAVDAILQVIAGLEAAQAGGILHRDVKPSNCFVAADGTVRVGDFGLSISSLPRHVTTLAESGAFQGTPEYAAPEQLGGEKLDVRADIYSVGATLFYLLTAHPPFEDQNREALVTLVSTAPVPSARRTQPAIPRELDRLVTRCLAKDKDARFATYAELTDALRPFSSASLKPASVRPRVLASTMGIVLPVLLAGPFLGLLLGLRIIRGPGGLVTALVVPLLTAGSLMEGLTGSTWSQHLCGLRVAAMNGGHPGVALAALRRVILFVPNAIFWRLAHDRVLWIPDPFTSGPILILPLTAAALGLVFSAARRRTGFVGLHDRLTRTRVVEKPPVNPAPPPTVEAALPVEESGHRMGPYDQLKRLGPTWEGTLYLAFDPRLKRSVWLHVYKSETPELPQAARAVSRPPRLHWLNGHRAGIDGSWDAYEAVDGRPLAADAGRPSWHVVGQWLLAIARECEASANDRSLDIVGTECLWIAADGRLKVLPFRAPGVETSSPRAQVRHLTGVIEVLREVVSLTTSAQPRPPLPLPATTCLESLGWPAITSLGDLVRAFEALTDVPDRVTRGTRAAGIGVSLLVYYFGSGVISRVLAPGVNLAADHLQIPMHLTPGVVGVVGTAWLSVFAAAILCGGVCLYASRIAVVTTDGREASPLRAALRAAIVWSWPIANFWAVAHGSRPLTSVLNFFAVAAIIWAIASPARGLQDYLAGTYLVPR